MSTQHDFIESVVAQLEDHIASNSNNPCTAEKAVNVLFKNSLTELMAAQPTKRFLMAYSLSNSDIDLDDRTQTITKFLESLFLANILVTHVDKDSKSHFFDEQHQDTFWQVLFYLAEELAVMAKYERSIIISFLNDRKFLKKTFFYIYKIILYRSNISIDLLETGEWINQPFVLTNLYGDSNHKQEPLPLKYAA
jgi:hypothetical protein